MITISPDISKFLINSLLRFIFSTLFSVLQISGKIWQISGNYCLSCLINYFRKRSKRVFWSRSLQAKLKLKQAKENMNLVQHFIQLNSNELNFLYPQSFYICILQISVVCHATFKPQLSFQFFKSGVLTVLKRKFSQPFSLSILPPITYTYSHI